MKYKLRKTINETYNALEQVLTNRNISYEDIYHYLHPTDNDINSPFLLGEENLKNAAIALISCIKNNEKALLIVDCDCDGFTSSALLLNYLHNYFASWIENNLKWFVHEGKQHGLSDAMEYINSKDFKLIICPDSASNDYEQHEELKEKGIDIIVLDHHEAEKISENAIIVNNQLSNYPNKDLSGVGIVWQFCRYLDKLMNTNNANNYLDLVALGNTGDVMSLLSIETKYLINKGFEPENIHNPYIYEMWQKNKFKLGDHITSIDAAFYIVPMINAVQRSGTIEEKEILFKSMLDYCAFDLIDSTKRGCKGEKERLVDQAVRMSTNVKNRQTKTQDSGVEYLENKIKNEKLLDHKVLLLLLDQGEVDPNIAGLICNKFANKYQRPCCILTTNKMSYTGSARGYELTGLTNFKDICEETNIIDYAQGHQNAFGISIPIGCIEEFIIKTDIALADVSTEPIYYVDFIYSGNDVDENTILTLGDLKPLYGKDFEEPFIAIENLKITKEMVQIFRKEKKDSDETDNTLKITLPNKVNLMKFKIGEEECEKFENIKGFISINAVGTCHINQYFNSITPQIFIENYEITGEGKYLF